MKYKSIIYSLIAGLLWSCNNDDTKITFTGGVPPVLSLSSTSDLVLSKTNEALNTLQFQWTNPNYTFSNGTSTHDVSYTLQIDTVPATGEATFTNPKLGVLTYTNDLNHVFTVRELNTALSQLELKDYVPHAFAFRIKSTLESGSVPQYSNVIHVNITTYLDVVFPVPAKLYITGDATPGNWMGGGDPELTSQKFTKTNAYTFELTLNVVSGQGFLFVPVYGDWNNKYGFTGAKHGNNANGDTFKPGGEDFQPPSPGSHKFIVNFKTGKYSVQ